MSTAQEANRRRVQIARRDHRAALIEGMLLANWHRITRYADREMASAAIRNVAHECAKALEAEL